MFLVLRVSVLLSLPLWRVVKMNKKIKLVFKYILLFGLCLISFALLGVITLKITVLNKNYIIKRMDKINYYDFTKQNTTSIGSYSNNINNFKNILKINDTSFFIYGFNEGTTLYLNFFSIKNGINSLQNEGIKSTNLELTSLDTEPDIKIIAEKLIISIISETKFITASYDISTNQLLKIEIPHSSELASFTVTKVSIRCSSLNGDNFFCVYHYYNPNSNQRQNPMFYAYGN